MAADLEKILRLFSPSLTAPAPPDLEPPELRDPATSSPQHARTTSVNLYSADAVPAQDDALVEWSRQKQEMLNWIDAWANRQERFLERALAAGRDGPKPAQKSFESLSSLDDHPSRPSPHPGVSSLRSGFLSNGTMSCDMVEEDSVEESTTADSKVPVVAGCIPGCPDEETVDCGVDNGRPTNKKKFSEPKANFEFMESLDVGRDSVASRKTRRLTVEQSEEMHSAMKKSQRQRLNNLADQIRAALEPRTMPERTGLLADLVESNQFTFLCTLVISLDTVFTAIESNRSMQNPGVGTPGWAFYAEVAFTSFYTFELLLKLILYRWYFFCNVERKWNWMDLLLVSQGVSDIILTLAISGDASDVTFMRLLKLLKLGKILRIFRALRFLRELRVMLFSIAHCLSILFWAFVMLAFIMYVFALFFVQLFASYFDVALLEGRETPQRDAAVTYFGDVRLAMVSLFQGASGGVDWYELYDIVTILGPLGISAFIFFIVFFQYAVVNILGGIFLENALAASLPDRESQALEQRRAEDCEADELKQVFLEHLGLDDCASSTIDLDDLTELAKEPETKLHLRTLGLDINDAVMFFEMMTEALGITQLPIDDFVSRLCRMKGTASAIDLQTVSYEVTLIRGMLNKLMLSTRTSVPDFNFFKEMSARRYNTQSW